MMRLLNTLRGCAVALAAMGIVFPQSAVLGAEVLAKQQNVRMADVALGTGGELRGQVVNAQGVAQAGRTVTVEGSGKELARLTTNAKGEFLARGLDGGVYLISTDGAAGPVRAWAPNTAPPAASNGIMLVPGTQTARGQLFGHGFNPSGIATNPGVWITGAVIGTILAVAIDQSSGS